MGNGPYVLMDAFAPPLPIVPPVLMAPLPLVFILPFVELMLGIVVAPLGAITHLVMKHNWETNIVATPQSKSHGHA